MGGPKPLIGSTALGKVPIGKGKEVMNLAVGDLSISICCNEPRTDGATFVFSITCSIGVSVNPKRNFIVNLKHPLGTRMVC